MINCPFTLNPNGLWQCPKCNWVFKRKSAKPPRRNCPALRTPEEKAKAAAERERLKHGPGTELKNILKRLHITASGGCKCNSRASLMNQEGPDWCEANINTIVKWMKEEASKRKLKIVFSETVAKLIVKKAIRNARKKLKILETP